MEKESIIEQISSGKIEDALKKMISIFGHDDKITALSARHRRYLSNQAKGILTSQELSVEINQITNSLLITISELFDVDKIDVKTPEAMEDKDLSLLSVIASEYPPSIVGGLGVHVYNVTKALSRYLKVNVVLPQGKYNKSDNEKLIINDLIHNKANYKDSVSWLRFAIAAASKIVREKDHPDVIHCHDWVTVMAGILVKNELKIPLVFHLHLPNKSRLCSSVENLGLLCADMVTVNSEFMSHELSKRNLNIKDIRIVRNGINPKIYRTYDNALESSEVDKYILFVGRLVIQKGVEFLIRAFALVRKKFPQIKLKIVGKGDLEDDLKRLAGTICSEGSVEFQEWTTSEKLADLYRNAELLVVPSIYEPFGMITVEAMACGCPVVAANVGGLQELIEHGQNGYLFYKKNHLDMAMWIMQILSNEVLKQDMKRKAILFVKNGNFAWDKVANDYYEIYKLLKHNKIYHEYHEDMEAIVGLKNQIMSVAIELDTRLKSENDQLFKDLFQWIEYEG